MTKLEKIKKEKRWIAYDIREIDGKLTKKPISPITGYGADSTNPKDWDTYERAKLFSETHSYTGVGLILNDDGLCCVDLDHCIENGQINLKALEIINHLNSYTEKSVSKTGVHIFLYCNEKFEKTRSNNSVIPIEIYSKKRYMAFTNDTLNNLDFEDRTNQLKNVYDTYLGINEFINKIKNKNDRDRFKKLFKGDTSDYSSHSEADFAFLGIIKKYTNDFNYADKILRISDLMREKYRDRPDYGRGIWNKLNGTENNKEEIKNKIIYSGEILTDFDVCNLIREKNDIFYYLLDDPKYLFYNGSYYEIDKDSKFADTLRHTIQDFIDTCGWSLKSIEKVRRKYLDNRGLRAIYQYYNTLNGIRKNKSDFNPDNHLICCLNGVVNLITGELLPFDKKYMMNYFVNIKYNKDAKYEGSLFEKFMNEICGNDQEKIEYLQYVFGYCLTGETKEQCFFYFIGNANTGKSLLLKLIKEIVGTYGASISIECYKANSNELLKNLARVKDNRLIISSEDDSNSTMNTSILKQLTGEDEISARGMYKDTITYNSKAKILFASNEMARFNSHVASVKRRLKAIIFNIVPNEIDTGLFKKLMKEKEIIFNWAIEGAKKYYENNKLPQPKFIDDTVNQIFAEQDIFIDWIDKNYDLDMTSFISTDELYKSYLNYCKNENEIIIKSKIDFSRKLNQKDYVKNNNKMPRGFWGLRRKEDKNNLFDLKNLNLSEK